MRAAIVTGPSSARPRTGRMVFVTFAWGACFIAIRWGLRDAPLLWFAALRGIVAGVALIAAGRLQGRHGPQGAGGWSLVAALAAINVTVAFAAMFAGVAGLATGTAAVLANAQPLLILGPAWLFFGEPIAPRAALGAALGLAGLVIVAVPGGGGSGAGLSLASAAAITAGTLLARRLHSLDLVMASGWHFLIGGTILAGWAAGVEGSPDITWTPRFIAVLAFLAIVGTAASFLIWFEETLRCPLGMLAAWTFLVPVVGTGLAAILLHEVPTGWTAIGVTFVFASMWTVLHYPRARSHTRHARSGLSRSQDPHSMRMAASPAIHTVDPEELPKGGER